MSSNMTLSINPHIEGHKYKTEIEEEKYKLAQILDKFAQTYVCTYATFRSSASNILHNPDHPHQLVPYNFASPDGRSAHYGPNMSGPRPCYETPDFLLAGIAQKLDILI